MCVRALVRVCVWIPSLNNFGSTGCHVHSQSQTTALEVSGQSVLSANFAHNFISCVFRVQLENLEAYKSFRRATSVQNSRIFTSARFM